MANKKNILLAGLAFLGTYLFFGKDKTNNTTPNNNSTSDPNLNTSAESDDSKYLDLLKAKNELEATDGIYSK